jgi:hypothetical protein
MLLLLLDLKVVLGEDHLQCQVLLWLIYPLKLYIRCFVQVTEIS